MPYIVVRPCLRSVLHFAGKCPLSSFVMCFKWVWHFTGNAYDGPVSMFEERPAFCRKCVSSSCAMCFKSFWHFMRNAFERPEFMFEESLAF